MKEGDISGGRSPPESGRVLLESARRGESNGTGLEVSAWLLRSGERKRELPQRTDVCQSGEGSHGSPLA